MVDKSEAAINEEKCSARIGTRVPQSLRDRLDGIAKRARLDISDVVRIGLMTQMPAIERVVLMQAAAGEMSLDEIADLVAAGQKAAAHGIKLVVLLENTIAEREAAAASKEAA